MPGPVVTPTSTPPATQEGAEPAKVDPVEPASNGVAISTNDGKTVAMPAVSYAPPPVQGQKATDRGEDAEFVVLHTRFGRFVRGSRITRSDISESADIVALVELGAIGPLGDGGEPLSPEATADLLKQVKTRPGKASK